MSANAVLIIYGIILGLGAMASASADGPLFRGDPQMSGFASPNPTGFPDQSTGVPRTQEKRMNLCAALKIYFTNVPGHEVAALGVIRW